MNLHNLIIHNNQEIAAQEFFDLLIAKQSPVLTAVMQSGKTGTFVCVADKIVNHCAANGVTNFRILHIINQSDKSVKTQTKDEYLKAFNYDLLAPNNGNIEILHHNDLKNVTFRPGEQLFILNDECHIALNNGGVISQFYSRLTANGVNCFIGYASATPYVYSILEKALGSFKTVVLSPGEEFYGVPEYHRAGRYLKAEHLFVKKGSDLSKFAKEVFLPDVFARIEKDGPGYVLARIHQFTQEQVETLQAYVESTFQTEIAIETYNCKLDNIPEAMLRLASPPKKTVFVIVSGSLRVGKTICKSHLRGVLDSPATKDNAAAVQSFIGRLCGYDVDHQDFNVYCQLKTIQPYIRWWNDVSSNLAGGVIPSSRYNRSNETIATHTTTVSFHLDHDSATKRALAVGIPEEFAKFGAKSLVSRNLEIDVAELIGKEYPTVPSKRSVIYKVDGPSPSFPESFKKILKHQGKYVLFEPMVRTVRKIEEASNALVSPNCFFKEVG